MHEFVEKFLAAADQHRGSETSARRVGEAAEELSAGLTTLMAETVQGSDKAGYVEVTVNLAGKLQRVRITPYAIRDLDVRRLGDACLEAIAATRSLAVARFREVIGEFPADLVNQDPAALIRRAHH